MIADSRVWDLRDSRVVYVRRNTMLLRSLEGGEETVVASGAELHSVAWSPDGTKLAYVQGNMEWITTNLGNVAPSTIWVVGVDGQEPVMVTDDTTLNVSPAWMPDGRHLLFISNRDGPRGIHAVRLGASGRPRGQPARLAVGMDPHSISVSSDGSTVAYSQFSFRQNLWEIAIPETGSVSMSQARPVTVDNQIIENHGLSPDGRWLAFDSDLAGNQDIYLMPAEGGEPTRVTHDPGDDFHPDFSPDGSEIVFYSTRHGTRDVFLISRDGRNEVRLTDSPGEDYHPAFSPDGLRIAFSRLNVARGGVYVMSRDSLGGEWTTPELLTADTVDLFYPRWSPDGSQIVGQSGEGIWVVSLEGEERLLVDGPGGAPDWSLDGSLVYFEAGGVTLYTIPAEGGARREVVQFDDPSKTVWPYFSLGSDKVYFSVKEIDSDIYVMDLEMK